MGYKLAGYEVVGAKITHHQFPNEISDELLCLSGSYPLDYNFNKVEPKYLIGMSVPPIMTARVADEIYKQWFNIN